SVPLAPSQDSWDNFLMSSPLSPEAFRNTLDAECRLARIDANEEIAHFYEDETAPHARQRYARTYHKLVGVLPEERSALRTALEQLRETGGCTVEDVIEHVRRQSGKTCSVDGGGGIGA